MHLELETAVAEKADVKKVVSKSSRKVESLEKEVWQIKALVEDIHSEQTSSRLVADSGEELLPGTAAKPLTSGDVQLRSQVWMSTWIIPHMKFEWAQWPTFRVFYTVRKNVIK